MSVAVSEDVPDYAMLWLPPFPQTSKPLISFEKWQQAGISVLPMGGNPITSQAAPHDAVGQQLVDIAQDHTAESRVARQTDRQRRRLAEGGALVRLPLEDCFKIGEEAGMWTEPEGTANEGQFDVTVAPFDRLMTAMRDFLYTRNEAFHFHRNNRLFSLIRESFGLRSGGGKTHWTVVPSSLSSEDGETPDSQNIVSAVARESCCLLRNTEDSVRGFLALLRREAEAGWDIGPPLQLANITAAFFSYIAHYKVFPEEPLNTRFKQAAILARMSPRLLLDAFRVDGVLADGRGWNRAVWAAWGGQYGGAERGGLEREIPQWPVVSSSDEMLDTAETGDWHVEIVGDERPLPPAKEAAFSAAAARLGSTNPDKVRMLGHLPYARRRVTAVIPPIVSPSEMTSNNRTSMYQLITVPAPWMASEGWRRDPMTAEAEGAPEVSDLSRPDADASGPLEREEATIADPELMTLWIEPSAVGTDETGQSLIGMALRGRWGLFGTGLGDEDDQWWAFKAKDYVLPALWCKA